MALPSALNQENHDDKSSLTALRRVNAMERQLLEATQVKQSLETQCRALQRLCHALVQGEEMSPDDTRLGIKMPHQKDWAYSVWTKHSTEAQNDSHQVASAYSIMAPSEEATSHLTTIHDHDLSDKVEPPRETVHAARSMEIADIPTPGEGEQAPQAVDDFQEIIFQCRRCWHGAGTGSPLIKSVHSIVFA
ncbi:unnamed protein product [Aphanomyces euteiches]